MGENTPLFEWDSTTSSNTASESLNLSFYDFTRNPLKLLTNSKLEDLEFPQFFHTNYNYNNLLINVEGPKIHKIEDEEIPPNTNDQKTEYNNESQFSNVNNSQRSNSQNSNNYLPFEKHVYNNIYEVIEEVPNELHEVSNIKSNNNMNRSDNKLNNYDDFNDIENVNFNLGLFNENSQQNVFKSNIKTNNEILVKSSNLSLSSGFDLLAINKKEISSVGLNKNQKIITKEFYSQQINSFGNPISAVSSKLKELKKFEQEIGIGLECPNYETFGADSLKEEMKKYGLKPASNKFMAKQLNEIWQFINMKKLPPNLKDDLVNFLSGEYNDELAGTQNSNNVSSKFGKGNIKNLTEEKKERIINIIQEDKLIWMKILKFHKLELKEVKDILNKKGIIIENDILKDYLSELGVIIHNPRKSN